MESQVINSRKVIYEPKRILESQRMCSPQQSTVIVSCVRVVVATIEVTPLPSHSAEFFCDLLKCKELDIPVRGTDAWEDLGAIPADAVLLPVHVHVRPHAGFHQ